jgi:predicted metal-dependent enzyme (double-stranded beta helix superfamily)
VPPPAPTERDLARLDTPVRTLLERVVAAIEGPVPDLDAIGAALIALARDQDYLEPTIRSLGDTSGSVGLHVPPRGPRLMLVHRRAGQMGAIHDHGCWVGLAPIRGIETHRRFRVAAGRDELARLELAADQLLSPGEVVTMLAPDAVHAHGHITGSGDPAYVLILTGDDQRLYQRTEWDSATGSARVLEPGDGGRWLDSQPWPG